MTQPAPLRWEQILTQAIGAKQVDRSTFADRSWLRLTNSQGTRGISAKPWDDPVPESTGDGKFTMYRKSYKSAGPGPGGDIRVENEFQILEFSVDFFVKGDGGRSPYDDYNRDWVTNFNDSIGQMNNVLDEHSFYSAANAFDNSVAWFQSSSDRLKPWIDDVDTKESGFQGSAAEAFRYQVLNLQYGFDKYREQLTTPQSWPTLLRAAGDQTAAFKQAVQKSWQGYLGLPSPRDVIVSVLRQIEQQVDSWDKQTNFRKGNVIPPDWSWEVLINVDNNVTMYNMASAHDIAALDFMMRWAWANQVVEFLDRPALTAYTPLNSAIETAYTASASPITLFEYPKANPTPNDPNNPNDPNKPPPGGDDSGGGNNDEHNFPNLGGDGGGDGGDDGGNGPNSDSGSNHNFPNLGGDGGDGGGDGSPDLGGDGGSNGDIPPPTTLATSGGGGGGISSLSDLTNTGGSDGSGGPPPDLSEFSGGGSGGAGPVSNLLDGDGNGNGGPSGVSGLLGFPGGGSTGGTSKPNAIDQLNGGVNGSGPFDDFTEPNAGGDDRDRALGGAVSGLNNLPGDVRTIDSVPGGGSESHGLTGTGIPSLDNPPEGFPPALHGGSSGINSPGSSFLGGSSPGGDGIGGLDDPGDGWELPSSAGGPAGGGLDGGLPTNSSGGDFSQLGANGPGGPLGSGPNGGLDANGLPIGDVGAVDVSAPGSGGPQSTGSNGTMGGMPFMPPMGGGFGQGGGQENKDRERSTWLTEDEDVWGTDPDCAPAVIGRDDSVDFDLIERGDWERVPTESSPPAKTAKPAGPDSPAAPSRAR